MLPPLSTLASVQAQTTAATVAPQFSVAAHQTTRCFYPTEEKTEMEKSTSYWSHCDFYM